MARTTTKPQRSPLLPPGARDFLTHRAIEISGLMLGAGAIILSMILLSYTPGDPSFNSASPHDVQNLLGPIGAYVADVMMQSFGLMSAIPVLVLFSWAWRISTKQMVSNLWMRLIVLCFATLFLSVAVHAFAMPSDWPLRSGLGGLAGLMLSERLFGLVALFGLGQVPFLDLFFAVICGVFGFVGLIYGLALSKREWSHMGHGVAVAAKGTVHGSAQAVSKGVNVLQRTKLEEMIEEEEGGIEEEITVLKRKKSAKKIKAPEAEVVLPKKSQKAKQQNLVLSPDSYNFPPLDLLCEASTLQKQASKIDRAALEHNAELLEQVLGDFGVKGEIVEVRPGPVVTLYELEPAAGTKTSRVISLADDIARSMSAVSVRIAVVPGRSVIGIELPNARRETVYLRELLESQSFENQKASLNMALGVDIGGQPVMADLARMPHLLVAGTTGSGKSVGVNTMILSLLYRMTPEQCKFIMIDPKMLELSVYDGIPHLLSPVVTEPGKAVMALKWCVQEMNERYRLMSNLGVRNISGYNAKLEESRKKGEVLTRRVQTGFDPETGKPIFEEQPLDMEAMPFLVIIVDEFADLMLMVGKEIDACIQSLAQKARAAGIHLIMATQRPSTDVMTGTIKANFPSRIAFTVTTKIDSRVILETQGAEQLLGMGDMLFKPGGGQVSRVHGPFASDEEVEEVVTHLKKQGEPSYVEAVTEESDEPIDGLVMPTGAVGGNTSSGDALYDQAVQICIQDGKASTSHIQRRLSIGYNRAARIVDQMEEEGIVTAPDRVGRRKIMAGKDGVE
ncbi:DNA translocase FtsK [Candidatus Terasakiella magnetica]|uniref:DNA translocase FtsK n=1 Tax=Candidatus Terasakiella magnetica TaxID=1867952 RepID=A0A1C3REX2_9PROT|nr:DNA translocase FtsK [Candidatus Terasakiella magnetica]SCA55805.1 DNA translocase FtsK [Candidatus Terasakiella magnetica]